MYDWLSTEIPPQFFYGEDCYPGYNQDSDSTTVFNCGVILYRHEEQDHI